MRPPRGTTLLVALLLVYFVTTQGRRFLPQGEEPPAFFAEPAPAGASVLLEGDFPRRGVHQFSDGTTLKGVINMTFGEVSLARLPSSLLNEPVRSGESLEILHSGDEIVALKKSWMPATQRLALGIPLHPDRMTREDWEVLPGVGPKLAEAIENDRQQNGDFGSLDALERVKGIGTRRIMGWKKFFSGSGMCVNSPKTIGNKN